MTTTLRNATGVGPSGRHDGGGTTSSATAPSANATLRRLRRRVSVLPLVLGLLTIIVSVAGTAQLLAYRGTVTTIWVAGRDLDADAPLTADALTTVRVAGAVDFSHYPVEAMSRDALLVAVPRADIPAGTPLSAGQFRQGPNQVGLPPGAVTVAIVLGRSHLPANLEPGDSVLLIGVPASSRPDGAAEGWPGTASISQTATVVAISEQEPSPEATVTVAVPRDVADDIAWLAGQGRMVIARDR